MGWNVKGRTVELIIAQSTADAEHFAVHELGLVKVDSTSIASATGISVGGEHHRMELTPLRWKMASVLS
jgi:hypothetical protein